MKNISPTFPAKMISPPFRVRLPGPSTVPLKVIEVVPVRVYILELDPWGILSGILTFGVKLKTFADMLLGQVVIEPEAREKFARATAPTGALKLEGPFKISPPGPSTLEANVIAPPVKVQVKPSLIATDGVKLISPCVVILLGQDSIEPESKEKLARDEPLPTAPVKLTAPLRIRTGSIDSAVESNTIATQIRSFS